MRERKRAVRMSHPSWPDRLFAQWYDRLTRSMEQTTFSPIRERLMKNARGDILEIGVGTGANLPFYDQEISGYRFFLDSSLPMLGKALQKGCEQSGRLVQGSASNLPFADQTFDTVVVTLVLCSVGDWESAIREIRRVLRSDGHLLLMEHVRSPNHLMATLQRVLTQVWKIPARGCHLDRPTDRALEECFRWVSRDRFVLSRTPFVWGILLPKPDPST
ncbi:MAG: class I SAM-dependent methyltransferase [Leptospirillum sp.]